MSEYQKWFEEYLGDIESISKSENHSPLSYAFNPFILKIFILIASAILPLSLMFSFLLAHYNSVTPCWLLEWGSNALLNVAFGLIVSLLMFALTHLRERNIVFMNDIIPILKTRYRNISDAYYEYCFKLDIHFNSEDYEQLSDSWHRQYVTGYVIIDFFEYIINVGLLKNTKYGVTYKILEEKRSFLEKANKQFQSCLKENEKVSNEVFLLCKQAMKYPSELLRVLKRYIVDCENTLFSLKYYKNMEK